MHSFWASTVMASQRSLIFLSVLPSLLHPSFSENLIEHLDVSISGRLALGTPFWKLIFLATNNSVLKNVSLADIHLLVSSNRRLYRISKPEVMWVFFPFSFLFSRTYKILNCLGFLCRNYSCAKICEIRKAEPILWALCGLYQYKHGTGPETSEITEI